jgi:hypothetical protein
MASFTPRNVRDVPAEEFIRAYAAHLKANDKVSAQLTSPSRQWPQPPASDLCSLQSLALGWASSVFLSS